MISGVSGFRASAGVTININTGAGNTNPLGGQAGGSPCACHGGDGFSPSSELLGGGAGNGLGIGGLPTGPALTQLMNQLASGAISLPGAGGGMGNSLPAALLGGGGAGLPDSILDGGGLSTFGGGAGSLTSQALMMQAASSDANQASLIMAQSGAMTGLSGAQGMALAGAGANNMMNGLMSTYM